MPNQSTGHLAFDLDSTRDPLRVLASTRPLAQDARSVCIVPERLDATAELLAGQPSAPSDWNAGLHPRGRDDAERANLVLALDALNFCFWSVPNAPRPRWQVTYAGQTHNGYWALAAALRRATEAGRPLADAAYLATLTEPEAADVLGGRSRHAGDPATARTAAASARSRTRALGALGRRVSERHRGSQRLGRDTDAREVYSALTSFHDISVVNGHEARFLKRAQILVGRPGPGPSTGRDRARSTTC